MGRTQVIAFMIAASLVAALVFVRMKSPSTSEAAPVHNAQSQAAETPDEGNKGLTEAPPLLRPAPQLTEVEGWLQTDKTSLEDFSGQVRIVQFWTFSCHNCTATIPHLQEIYRTHQDDEFEIIGVHTPEFDFERDPQAVADAAEELGVTWPIALDPEKTNFREWQGDNRFWPRTYVLDQTGNIRFDHIGEGSYEELAQTVAWLIENGP